MDKITSLVLASIALCAAIVSFALNIWALILNHQADKLWKQYDEKIREVEQLREKGD